MSSFQLFPEDVESPSPTLVRNLRAEVASWKKTAEDAQAVAREDLTAIVVQLGGKYLHSDDPFWSTLDDICDRWCLGNAPGQDTVKGCFCVAFPDEPCGVHK